MYLCKFGAGNPTGLEDRAQKSLNLHFFKDDDLSYVWPWKLGQGHQNYIILFNNDTIHYVQMDTMFDLLQKPYFGQNLKFQSAPVTLKIRSSSPKYDQPFPYSKQCNYVSLVKIYQLVQKIMHGNHILDIAKCLCDREKKVVSLHVNFSLKYWEFFTCAMPHPANFTCNFVSGMPSYISASPSLWLDSLVWVSGSPRTISQKL